MLSICIMGELDYGEISADMSCAGVLRIIGHSMETSLELSTVYILSDWWSTTVNDFRDIHALNVEFDEYFVDIS